MENKNRSIVVDTSGLISLLIATDSNHERALKASEKYDNHNVIIPNDVIVECINVLGKKINHQVTYDCATEIMCSPSFTIYETNESIRSIALEIFLKSPLSVSYTDCIVMSIADELNTKYIFGFDEVFSKNGYIMY